MSEHDVDRTTVETVFSRVAHVDRVSAFLHGITTAVLVATASLVAWPAPEQPETADQAYSDRFVLLGLTVTLAAFMAGRVLPGEAERSWRELLGRLEAGRRQGQSFRILFTHEGATRMDAARQAGIDRGVWAGLVIGLVPPLNFATTADQHLVGSVIYVIVCIAVGMTVRCHRRFRRGLTIAQRYLKSAQGMSRSDQRV